MFDNGNAFTQKFLDEDDLEDFFKFSEMFIILFKYSFIFLAFRKLKFSVDV